MLRRRMGLFVFFWVTLLAGLGLLGVDTFSVKTVTVTGSDRPGDVLSLADIRLGSLIFGVDPDAVEQRIESSPYFDVTAIRRELPSGITIEVEERSPAAMVYWQDAYQVIGADGTVLDTVSVRLAHPYPVITGMKVDTWETGDRIGAHDPRQLVAMRRVLVAAQSQEAMEYISEVDIADPENITILSPHGMTVNIGDAGAIDRQMQWVREVVPRLYAMGYTKGLLTLTSPDQRTADFLPESRMTKPVVLGDPEAEPDDDQPAPPLPEGEPGASPEDGGNGDDADEPIV